MSDVVIRANQLGKRYRLTGRPTYRTLRESISRLVTRGQAASAASKDFWALRNISFDVRQGEVIGVIGRNGAGKSTLLKILSRITGPTEGSVTLSGRVGSLLEVGTGFHPELSGRENIYLNGAILGMGRTEIGRKFDEIVAFSELEQFLDTAVKRYSSGMYMRLAFAVAAHLDPEILVVDEVLAVGDAAFQKKCMGKMGDVARQGRTVLFVSHNMGAVVGLCQRCLLLRAGSVAADGPAAEVVGDYVKHGEDAAATMVWDDPAVAPGNDKIRIRAVRVWSEGGVTGDVRIDRDVEVEVEFQNLLAGARVSTSIHLLDPLGACIFASVNWRSATAGIDPWSDRPYPVGTYRTRCVIPAELLNEGTYRVSAFVLTDVSSIEATAREAVSFTAHDAGGMRAEYVGEWIGSMRPRLAWRTEAITLAEALHEAAEEVTV